MRIQTRPTRGLFLAVTAFAVIGAVGVAVSPQAAAITDDEREVQAAVDIYSSMCGRDGQGHDERSAAWYSKWMDIEQRSPYELKNNGNPAASARKKLYNDSAFNMATRKKICTGTAKYAETVKDMVVDMKGKTKSCCTTESGLKKFFKDKIQAFQDLNQAEEDGTLR